MIRAIVFDFDGTLADTLPSLTEGINRAMEHFSLPMHTEAEVRTYINHGARELCRAALPEELRSDEVFLDRVLAFYNDAYSKVCESALPYDGIPALLEALHTDYRIGVLSNKPDPFLCRLCEVVLPHGCIDVAQGVIAGHPTKPDPFLSHRVAARLGVSPEECVLIGDSDVDLATARNAGMLHVGVTWGFVARERLREVGVRNFADTPEEILTLLASPDALHS